MHYPGKYKKGRRMRQSALVLAVVLLSSCGNFGLNEEQLMQRAWQYMQQGEYRAAAIEARNTLQKNPQNADARYLLAVISLQYGDYRTAEREYRLVDNAGWGDGLARIGRARALLELGELAQVVDATKLLPDYSDTVKADLLALQAAAQSAMGQPERARASLQQATALDPSAWQVVLTQIRLLLAEDEIQQAASAAEAALGSYPDNAGLLLEAAEIALLQNDNDKANQLLARIIADDPPDYISGYGVIARLSLVQQLILEGRFDEARAMLKPLYARTRNGPYTNYLGGLVAFASGDYDLAEQRLLKVLKVVPDHGPTRLLFATVNFAQQDYEQAAYFLSKYLFTDPDNIEARKLLGRCYILLDQPGQASEALQPALSDDTGSDDDAELLMLVGMSKLNSGDSAEGIRSMERALLVSEHEVTLRKELAEVYMTTGETSLAIRELQASIDNGADKRTTLLIIGSLQQGEFERAINLALDLLASNPHDPVAISLAGNVFAASGDYREARRYFKQALTVQADYFPATMALARLEELDGNVAGAVSLYRELLAADADSVVPYLALARLEGQQGSTVEIVGLLQSASKKYPNENRPRLLLVEHYIRERQFDKAELILKEEMQSRPGQPLVMYLQASLLLATGENAAAIKVLKELLAKDPESSEANLLLAQAYNRLGDVRSARVLLLALVKQYPDAELALGMLAEMDIQSGNLEPAFRYSQRIQQVNPDSYLGYMLMGDVWVKRQNDDEARKLYVQAWELERRSELVVRRAEVQQRTDGIDAAIEVLAAWLNGHPDDVRVRTYLGTTYHDAGRDEQAITEYEKVLAANPDDVTALNNLAWIYFKRDNPEAGKLAERAWQLAPDAAGVLDTYGWILLQQGELERGKRLLAKAARRLSGIAEVRYHYAIALYETGDEQKARVLLESVVEVDAFDGQEHARQVLQEISG